MDHTRKYLTLNCEICNKEYKQQKRVYKKAKWKDRCPSHRKRIYRCKHCNVQTSRGYNRCKYCAAKEDRGLPKNYCIDCNTKIGNHSTRCLSCHNINQDEGKSTERTKFNNSKEWKILRKECFKRDNYTCQKCNTRGGYLNAHHIKYWSEYPELRLKLDNLLTVCRPCHEKIHWG